MPQVSAPATATTGLLPAFLEHLDRGVLLADAEGRVEQATPFLRTLFGVADEEVLVRRPLGEVLARIAEGTRDPASFQATLRTQAEAGQRVREAETVLADGSVLRYTYLPVPDAPQGAGHAWWFEPPLPQPPTVGPPADAGPDTRERLLREQLLSAAAHAAHALLATGDEQTAIQQALNVVSEVTGSDRAYIFQNHAGPSPEDGIYTSQRYEWCREGIEPQIDNPDLQNFPFEDALPAWYGTLAEGHPRSAVVQHLPPDEREVFEAQQILSVLLVPIHSDQAFWGFIGFDDCTHERVWSEGERAILMLLASNIGAFLERRQIEESLELSYQVLSQIKNVVFVFDGSGSVRYASPSTRTVLEAEPDDLLGRGFWDHMVPLERRLVGEKHFQPYDPKDPSHLPGAQAIIEEIRKKGFYTSEARYELASGDVRTLLWFVSPTDDDRFITVGTDVTKLEEARAAVTYNEERFQLLVNNLPDVFFFSDTQGRARYLSPTARHLFGGTGVETDVLGDPAYWMQLVHPDDRPLWTDAFERLPHADTLELEYRIVLPDTGEVRWLQTRFFRAESSTLDVEVGGFVMDITERKQIDLALQRSEAHARALVSALDAGVLLLDHEGVVLEANEAARHLLADWVQPGRSLHLPPRGVLSTDGAPIEAGDLPFARALASGGPVDSAILGLTAEPIADGDLTDVQWIAVSAAPYSQDGGEQPTGVVVSMTDVTPIKRAAEEHRRNLEREQELSALKSRFISMASHEFRTPLASIRAAAEMVARYEARWSPEQKAKYLERIQSEVIRMTRLLEEVLLVGKADAGMLPYQPSPFEAVQVVDEVIQDVRILHPSRHQIEVYLPDAPVEVQQDEVLLRHITSNLVSNAIKYTPEGGRIEVSFANEGETLRLTVRDEGIGIADDEQPRIFDSFYRSDRVGTISGTGLGLAIVERAVDLCGGSLAFESQLNEGTTFTARLPRHHPV